MQLRSSSPVMCRKHSKLVSSELKLIYVVRFDSKTLQLDVMKDNQVLDFFLELANQVRKVMGDRKVGRRMCAQ